MSKSVDIYLYTYVRCTHIYTYIHHAYTIFKTTPLTTIFTLRRHPWNKIVQSGKPTASAHTEDYRKSEDMNQKKIQNLFTPWQSHPRD